MLLNSPNIITLPISRLRTLFPAIAFFGGFIWDALTIGRSVQFLDLWLLLGYLLAAAAILWWLGYKVSRQPAELPSPVEPGRFERVPYLLLQFLFGGLFSALFIFYIKSADHALALLLALVPGVLLVANEFIHDKYRKFTLTWALFGLCAMLLFNFLLPFMVGSIHFIWFYLSTLAGAGLVVLLRNITPGHPGKLGPVWLIAALLAIAYPLDVIPPVPLVKRDIGMGIVLEKSADQYLLTHEKPPLWEFWTIFEDDIHLEAGQRLYCVSMIFAPRGLSARLYHSWQYYDAHKGWVSTERIGFNLQGGRNNGFRGSTYKQNLWPGKWRVSVETENGRTVAVHGFNVLAGTVDPGRLSVRRF